MSINKTINICYPNCTTCKHSCKLCNSLCKWKFDKCKDCMKPQIISLKTKKKYKKGDIVTTTMKALNGLKVDRIEIPLGIAIENTDEYNGISKVAVDRLAYVNIQLEPDK